MVGVIAAMGGEVESNGQACLASLEIATVEGVGFLGRREAGVLAHGPGTAGVHRGTGSTNIGGHSGQRAYMVEAFEVLGRVQGLDGDALGCVASQGIERLVAAFFLGKCSPVIQRFLGKIGHKLWFLG